MYIHNNVRFILHAHTDEELVGTWESITHYIHYVRERLE